MAAGAFTRHSWQETCAVRFVRLSMGEFCRLVRRTVEGLPERFQPYLENVVVDVELEPSDEHWERVEGRDDLSAEEGLLLGLFVGVPLTSQPYGDHHPNVIKIFKRPIEEVSETRRELETNIRKTVIHELAHHFGFKDEDEELERFDNDPETS